MDCVALVACFDGCFVYLFPVWCVGDFCLLCCFICCTYVSLPVCSLCVYKLLVLVWLLATFVF